MTTRRGEQRRADTPRAIVRDRRGAGTRYEADFDGRPVFDFLVSLILDADDEEELLADDRRWFTASRAGMPAALRELLDLERRESGPPNLPALAIERPEIADAAGYVRAVEELPAGELVRALLADVLERDEVAPHSQAALAGDPAAFETIREQVGPEQSLELLRDPDASLATLRTGLRYWLERYRMVEDHVRRALERDVADRAIDRATLPAPELVERTTGGIRFFADPGIRRVLLAPTYFGRPYNHIFAADGWRLFCYPIAESAIGGRDGFAPPPGTVRLHRALGDATRLRVLKLLAERDHYLTELAQQLGLSKPTMKHHLAQLRIAGLVSVTEEGSLTYYSLRRDRLDAAGKEVRDYLRT
ncbi:MAG: metalloregulator ArsR/SmtB family transcription factor [Chloroflexota bacterium]|nr:metalloregulator ArsR/SmtB family transcription factor [Chloroflexota bacterium]